MASVKITKDNFEAEVKNSGKTVLLDFWAPWCGPCKRIGPIIEEVAAEAPAGVLVGKVNVDEEQDLAMSFGIMSIPTLVLFKDGKVAGSWVGGRPKEDILAMIA